jgi:hypothetical protein
VWSELVDQIDAQTGGPNGVYAQARAAWAGDEAAKEAVRHASGIFTPGVHTEWMEQAARWSPSERLAAEVGAYQAIRDQIARNAGSFLGQVGRDRALQERLRAVFGNQVDDLIRGFEDDRVAMEAIRHLSPRTGSPTAPRQAAEEHFADSVADAGLDLVAGGNPTRMVVNAMRALMEDSRGLTVREAENVLRMAMEPYAPSTVRNAMVGAMQRQAVRQGRGPAAIQGPVNVMIDEPFTRRRANR